MKVAESLLNTYFKDWWNQEQSVCMFIVFDVWKSALMGNKCIFPVISGARTHNLSLGRINVCDIFFYKKTLLNPSRRLPDVDTAQRIFEKFNFNDWTGEDDAVRKNSHRKENGIGFLFQLLRPRLLRAIFVHDFRFEILVSFLNFGIGVKSRSAQKVRTKLYTHSLPPFSNKKAKSNFYHRSSSQKK